MNVADIFLTLGIKGDTKSLEDAIKKVEELRKKTEALNKELKNSEKIKKESASTGKTRASKDPELAELKRATQFKIQEHKQARETLKTEKEAVKLKAESAKTEKQNTKLKAEFSKKEILENKEKDRQFDRATRIKEKEQKKEKKLITDGLKAEEKEKTKLEKEQKKREKDREKATKAFFNQIENGFSFIAKAFTGALVGGGIGGYVTSQASKQVSLAASLRQYNISPEQSQRYANVFREASYGQIGTKETDAFIANLAERIGRSKYNPAELLPFNMIGADPSKITDFDSAIKEIRSYAKNPNYKSENITALLGELGLPREFTPAFTKEFSDEQFNNAYTSAKILSNAEVGAAAKLNLEFAKLGNSFDVLQGKMLKEFAPALERVIKYIDNKLTPENAEKIADAATGIGAGYAITKAVKTAVKYGKGGVARLGVAAAGGYGLYQGLSYLADKNEKNFFPQKYKKRKEAEKKGTNYEADFGNFEVNDRLKMNPNYKYSQEDIAATMGQSVAPNVTTTVNINAGSVDKDTAPFIADEINRNVNRSLYDSKYPTLITPK
jgi:hypothetical protein